VVETVLVSHKLYVVSMERPYEAESVPHRLGNEPAPSELTSNDLDRGEREKERKSKNEDARAKEKEMLKAGGETK
jgi:hypothetical protein